MKRRKIDLSVGVFFMIGIASLVYLSVHLGEIDFFVSDTYVVKAKFESVTGLRNGASIEMSGVPIGKISKIELKDEEAIVTLQLKKSIKLSEDAIASIRTKGILGAKYLSISQGGAEKRINAGGIIRETEPPLDFEKLIGKFIFGKIK